MGIQAWMSLQGSSAIQNIDTIVEQMNRGHTAKCRYELEVKG
jgi:hypothetical protein